MTCAKDANSRIKIGRNHRVTEQAKKLINLVYCHAEPWNLAWKKAGYTSQYSKARVQEVFDRKLCAEYIKQLQGDETARLQASKQMLIEELVTRLKESKNLEAVQIVRTLNSMLGYDEPEKVNSKVEIIWKGINEQ